ncbi:hypothetical protein WA026_018356 [Henosepilachna vigintioctopunctata]|uniref:Elongin-B n=1 Tax=Henosepilachna vigintioctopunctata TaxID=420089 RepID=A0AAW1VER3_9CUCU
MDVFMMVRRKKLTMFIDAKDTSTVLELKKIIEGILKVSPKNQRLYKETTVMDDEKQLQDFGLNSNTAKVQNPAPLGLTVRDENGEFESLELTPYSAPPYLPDVMKSEEIDGQEQSP